MIAALARHAVLFALVACCACGGPSSCGAQSRTTPAPSLAAAANASYSFGGPLPGAPPLDAALANRLEAKWKTRPSSYRPRTRHLRDDGSPQYTNRLFLQSSPYLLQHAHNPVDWYSWGDDAFETAKRLHRPIFLSVGYSTCHWCHVMEEESFENEEIARYLNENFVAIKVDREERPDVDAVYMQAVESLTGSGGWPMSVWLTDDRRPFYGGTYFPASSFAALLRKLKGIFTDHPDQIVETAKDLTEDLRRELFAADRSGDVPPESLLRLAASHYAAHFDGTNGGMSGAPKFPSSLPIRLLLRIYRRTGDQQALKMATLTLEKMAAGGMHDHVGGGFHRYSTDASWLVPHFEKMLYDNALLAIDYLEGYQVTGRADFARVAGDILRYVARDMTAPEGAFYSATDADSAGPNGEREEGWYFTWTPSEIGEVLGVERARIVDAYFAVDAPGNFHGRSVLHTPTPLGDVARSLGLARESVEREIEAARESLYTARGKRPAPARDEKILTSWNGLMISAYARAALVLGDSAHAERAARAAEFILAHLRKDGLLVRSFKDGESHTAAYLDDYAFFIAGLLDLFEATGDARWIREAISLDEMVERHNEDPQSGGYFLTADDEATPLGRHKPGYDGAEPSGNSVQALNLLRLHQFTFSDRLRRKGERTLSAFARTLADRSAALSEMLVALDFFYDSPKEIVIVTPRERGEAAPFLRQLGRVYLPNRALSVVVEGTEQAALAEVIPAIGEKTAQRAKATAYVCERRVCDLPTVDPEVFARQLKKVQMVR